MTDPNQPGYPQQGHPGGAPGPGQPGVHGQPTHEPEKKQITFSLPQVVGAVLLVLLIIFIVENTHSVPIRIIAGPELHPPVWVAILIAAVVGALISALLRYRRRVTAKRKAELREHRAENR
jgi:uncharacterized integral membrane protein